MGFVNSVMVWLMTKRMHQIELYKKYPIEVQNDLFKKLISAAENTEWGKHYNYKSIKSREEYQKNVPVSDYDALKPYIERIQEGEQNVLWASDIKWFAKSSGTTSDKSKYIPVSPESLEDCHYKGGKDMLAIYCTNFPDTKMYDGLNLALGGSHQVNELDMTKYYGDVSAIIIENLPFWAELYRTPKKEVALLDEWEEKITKIVEHTVTQNVTSVAGVPSWISVVMRKVLEYTGKDTIKEVWPNLELYFHGGVNFAPYRKQTEALIGSPSINYMNIYNASEGYFGIQDQIDCDDLLLLLDNGVYYEFLPMDEVGKEFPQAIQLQDVEIGKNYAIVISTNAGLWRYVIGDMVSFTSKTPYRIKITGRTKSFINVCGEEVIVDNTDKALKIACDRTNAVVNEYSAAPYFYADEKIAHQWIVEFIKEPESIEYFATVLDDALKSLNSDYEAKRYKDFVLKPLIVENAPKGTFYQWLQENNRLGGQNKVPRLSNERKHVEGLLKTISRM